MKKTYFFLATLMLISSTIFAQDIKPDASYYGVGFWSPDTLGNHRVVLSVDKKADVILADVPWRRRDKNPENKGLILINATTGDVVSNVHVNSITQESGSILFEAPTVGQYFLYYLPYKTTGGPYPQITYAKGSTKPNQKWLEGVKSANISNLPKAKLVEFQSLSEFDGFYPMEIIATKQEKAQLVAENRDKPYLLFPEVREHSIRMFDEIPYRWIVRGASSSFSDEVDMNEYFVFQLGLWANKSEVKGVNVKFSDLKLRYSNNKSKDLSEVIPSSAFTCFNTEGQDWLRREMALNVNVPKGKIQPLWIGLDIPAEGLKSGVYTGAVTIEADGMPAQTVELNINLSDYILTDRGDSDIDRLSRLRWLNSDFGFDNEVIRPYKAVKVKGKQLDILGRSVTLNSYGLPESILSYFTEEMTGVAEEARPILSKPINFVVKQDEKVVPMKNNSFEFKTKEEGLVTWSSENSAGNLDVNIDASLEFDGFMEYKIKVTARERVNVDDIYLDVPMEAGVAKYWLGMGHEGSFAPTEGTWKWDVKNKCQEGYWFGDVNAGLQCLFRDTNYKRPLNTNFYRMMPLNAPLSWYNDGKGGISYKEKKGTFSVKTYSGDRVIEKGEELNFIVLLTITPFRSIDTKRQWSERYIHRPIQAEEIEPGGANVINVHHANPINPFINYPFLRPDYMKAYIDELHSKGAKVKIYYTVRELANRAPELWALKSLGNEIFAAGTSQSKAGYSWLQEHMGDDYIGAWFVDKYKDAAIVNTGVSRWHNYYVEGLNWLAKNVGIDGVYIDDLGLDRTTMKRVRKALERNRPNPIIDLHSANQFNKGDGFTNSIFLYMEHMPYVDRVWFGEYFKYEETPDYWMTEVAGIPFGVMGEMLEGGGNPWRGMLYGMTRRFQYGSDAELPKYFWKVWDDFGIQDSRMMGYWVSYNPVKSDNKEVLATTFVKDGKVMVALASWANEDVEVKLKIDWDRLKIDPNKAKITFPEISTIQESKVISIDAPIKISPEQGCLIIIE